MSLSRENSGGRLAIVTGAGGDLAGTVVPRLVEQGWRVALTTRPGSEARTTARYSDLGVPAERLHAFGVDLAASASVEVGFEAIRAAMGTPAALVHLAGRFEGGPRPDASVADAAAVLERTLDGNLRSAAYAIAAVLPAMLAAGKGAIVAVGAAAGTSPAPGSVAYAAAKAALAAYLRSVAAQAGKGGVSVGLVVPQGAFDTPGNRAAMPKADPEGWISPVAFAEAVEFLLARGPRGMVHELPLSAH